MPIVKCSILVLLQLISYCLSAQYAHGIILEKEGGDPSEMLSVEHFERINDITVVVDTKESKSLVQSKHIASSTSSRQNIREDRLGLNWSIGFGVGHSSNAASYAIDDGFRIKEFSGLRSIVLDTKIGWGFHESLVVFGTWKYAPSNTTISPYRSSYLGGGLAYYFGELQQFSIHGGLGTYQAKVGRNEVFGNGLLVNYGTVIKFGNNFGIELNVLSGEIELDSTNSISFDSTELNLTAGVALIF